MVRLSIDAPPSVVICCVISFVYKMHEGIGQTTAVREIL